jgi:hypothetical protein
MASGARYANTDTLLGEKSGYRMTPDPLGCRASCCGKVRGTALMSMVITETYVSIGYLRHSHKGFGSEPGGTHHGGIGFSNPIT